eukprot:scaffold38410_cov41-Phaeocystis_antarctica.AAC.1
MSDGSRAQPKQARLSAACGAPPLWTVGCAAAVAAALAASLSAFSAVSALRTSLVAAPRSGFCSRNLASSGLKPRSGSATCSRRTASRRASAVQGSHIRGAPLRRPGRPAVARPRQSRSHAIRVSAFARLKVHQQRRRVPHPRLVVTRGSLPRFVPDLRPRSGEQRGQGAHLFREVGGHDREPRAQTGEPRDLAVCDLVIVLRLRVRVGLVEQLLGDLCAPHRPQRPQLLQPRGGGACVGGREAEAQRGAFVRLQVEEPHDHAHPVSMQVSDSHTDHCFYCYYYYYYYDSLLLPPLRASLLPSKPQWGTRASARRQRSRVAGGAKGFRGPTRPPATSPRSRWREPPRPRRCRHCRRLAGAAAVSAEARHATAGATSEVCPCPAPQARAAAAVAPPYRPAPYVRSSLAQARGARATPHPPPYPPPNPPPYPPPHPPLRLRPMRRLPRPSPSPPTPMRRAALTTRRGDRHHSNRRPRTASPHLASAPQLLRRKARQAARRAARRVAARVQPAGNVAASAPGRASQRRPRRSAATHPLGSADRRRGTQQHAAAVPRLWPPTRNRVGPRSSSPVWRCTWLGTGLGSGSGLGSQQQFGVALYPVAGRHPQRVAER